MSIIGVTGVAGSGKDAIAHILVSEHGWTRIALADPMKRAVADWFGFTDDQLHGPSARRNEVDERWGITPRHTLQQLGTEYGRAMHEDLWVRYAVDCAKRVLDDERGLTVYEARRGVLRVPVERERCPGVVIPDVRFENEAAAIRATGGRVWRVVRSGAGLAGLAAQHVSETEQSAIEADYNIINDGSLEDLSRAVLDALTERQ